MCSNPHESPPVLSRRRLPWFSLSLSKLRAMSPVTRLCGFQQLKDRRHLEQNTNRGQGMSVVRERPRIKLFVFP